MILLINEAEAILRWKGVRVFLLTSRDGTPSTYPTVVIVTNAHQAPSRTPLQKDKGNWRWLILWSWLKIRKSEQEQRHLCFLSNIFRLAKVR